MEKNLNVPEDETDAEEAKNQQQVGSDDVYAMMGLVMIICVPFKWSP